MTLQELYFMGSGACFTLAGVVLYHLVKRLGKY